MQTTKQWKKANQCCLRIRQEEEKREGKIMCHFRKNKTVLIIWFLNIWFNLNIFTMKYNEKTWWNKRKIKIFIRQVFTWVLCMTKYRLFPLPWMAWPFGIMKPHYGMIVFSGCYKFFSYVIRNFNSHHFFFVIDHQNVPSERWFPHIG